MKGERVQRFFRQRAADELLGDQRGVRVLFALYAVGCFGAGLGLPAVQSDLPRPVAIGMGVVFAVLAIVLRGASERVRVGSGVVAGVFALWAWTGAILTLPEIPIGSIVWAVAFSYYSIWLLTSPGRKRFHEVRIALEERKREAQQPASPIAR